MMRAKAKIAVIGTGWWSTHAHIPALVRNDRVGTLVLVDKNQDALQAAAQAYQIQNVFTSLAEALNAHPDLHGAVLALPHAAHYAVAKECLEHGLHILLEKPMTLYAKEAKALVELAAQKQREIIIGYVYPYLEQIRQAKGYVEEELLGDIEYVTCSMTSMTIEFLRGKPEEYRTVMNYEVTGPTERTYSDPALAGGGQGHLQITHSAALMFHLAPGLRAQTVSAFMNHLDCKVDVADAIAVRMTNGAVATVGSTGNIGKGDSGIVEVHLHGSKGRLQVDAISGSLYLRLHHGREERLPATYPVYPAEVPTQRLVEVILDGMENPSPGGTVGLYTVELLDAAYRSAAQGGTPVQVESLYQ
jgi:predicted dehydrogenase